MYTLRKSVQWLADQAHVKEECGPYVTRPDATIPPWPQLLHLYSRLKAGRTVLEWMEAYNVLEQGIDVRRFTSFGVIKGFLRRVHRWPFLSQPLTLEITPQNTSTRARTNSLTEGFMRHSLMSPTSPVTSDGSYPSLIRGKAIAATTTATSSISPDTVISGPSTPLSPSRLRRASAAEKVLEQVRSRDIQKASSPRTSWIQYPASSSYSPTLNSSTPAIIATTSTPQESPTNTLGGSSESRRMALLHSTVPPNSPIISKAVLPQRPRLSRSPSAPAFSHLPAENGFPTIPTRPAELSFLLDGEHHTDELAVRFEVGWSVLEQWLVDIGGGKGDGDYGNVSIIYR